MAFLVEELTRPHLDETQRVYNAIFGQHPAALDFDKLACCMESGDGIFYIAIDPATDRVIGFKFGVFENDKTCIGSGIGVLPEYRRQGIATQMLRAFENDLRHHPTATKYHFGSGTFEGIPFHIASGYYPQALIQFSDEPLREKLDFSDFQVNHAGYNDEYDIYQVFLQLDASQANWQALEHMQSNFPETNIQFFFGKEF